MKYLKFALIISLFFFCGHTQSQVVPPRDSTIHFAKRAGMFSRYMFEEKKFGRSLYSFNAVYFIDHGLNLNNRRYHPTGYLFYKFERYCNKKQIYYNKEALKKFRRKSILAGAIYFFYTTSFIPIILNAAYSPTPCPECF